MLGPMKVELAFEKQHQRRVLPTRSLANAAPVKSRKDPNPNKTLRDLCRAAVAECGPAPYLYAEKHCPPAMKVMGGVERALWPATKNVPSTVPSLEGSELEAALFRTFRHQIPVHRFVDAWAEGRPEHVIEVFAGLDDFDVALAWGTEPVVHIDVETKGSTSIAMRGHMFRTRGGSVEWLVARAMREVLASATPEEYARAVAMAREVAGRPETSLWTRAGLAFALPDEADLCSGALEALLATHSTALREGLDVAGRMQWLRWMLSVTLEPEAAIRALDALADQVSCPEHRDENPLFTWVALEHRAGRLDAVAQVLVERASKHLGGRGWAIARTFGDALAGLRGELMVTLFVDHIAHKALEKSAPEYLERHADLALGRLFAASRVKGKHQKRALELAQVLAQKRPDLADAISDSSEAAARGPTVRREVASAAASELPRVLAEPPWEARPPKKPTPTKEVVQLPYEERIDLEHGELEAWAETLEKESLLREIPGPVVPGVNVGSVIYGLRHESSRRKLLAMHGVAAIDWLLLHARDQGFAGVEPMSRIDSPRIAETMARTYVEASGWGRIEAQLAIVRHPRAAAIGLVPPAAMGDQFAREGLRLLVLAGAGDVLREVLAESGAAAAQSLSDIPLSRENIFPSRAPSLPPFFMAEGLPPPRLVSSGNALSPATVAALGVLLKGSDTLFPSTGLAEVRAACTAASLDAFVSALEKAWEHAKAPDSQSFAATATGHLGSEAALRRLADEVATLEKKKPKIAVSMLEAFAASPLPAGASLLGRIASHALEPKVRDAAERWLFAIQSARGVSRESLSWSFPTCGFSDATVSIEGDFVAVLDDSLGLSLRRGKKKGAPKDLSPEGLATWTELKAAIADTTEAIEGRLELALASQEPVSREAFEGQFLMHPLVSRLAKRAVFGDLDASCTLLRAFRPLGNGRFVDEHGREVSLVGDKVSLLHPFELDRLGEGVRKAFLGALESEGLEGSVDQLTRATFPTPADWPTVRGTIVPYRKLEKLIERRGYRLYRTHCGGPFHDPSYLQKTVDGGRVRLLIGFAFGQRRGDSVLGEVFGQHEDGVAGVRQAARRSPVEVSRLSMSELLRDLASLTG